MPRKLLRPKFGSELLRVGSLQRGWRLQLHKDRLYRGEPCLGLPGSRSRHIRLADEIATGRSRAALHCRPGGKEWRDREIAVSDAMAATT
jgi:hypothetical protein